jgi:carbon-monoxide dehydrogenase medium subunit
MLAPCLTLGAQLEVVSPESTRNIEIKDFFTGVKKHVLAPNEMVVKIILPKAGGVSSYRKKKRIKGHDLAQVGVAGSYGKDGSLKLAFGAVAPTPLLLDLGVIESGRLREKKGEITQKAVESVNPISDARSSKEHRLAMIRFLTGEVIDELLINMEAGV